jgi:CheY-like chemotaxis protein
MTSNDKPDTDELVVAGAVHDVNQMLTVVTGHTGLLLEQVADEDVKRHLQAILLAADDAATILQRLAGRAPEAAPGADLRNEAERARLLVWPTDDPGYAWDNSIAAGTGVGVPAQVLREVLINLLLNALAAMPTGGSLRLSAHESEGRVIVRVADSGPGLPTADPEVLFRPGVSGSGQEGRGIGLAGCRRLLANVGGRLAAEVKPTPTAAPGGAVFFLDLPTGTAARRSGRRESTSQAGQKLPSMGVLVVDDESVVRDMLREVIGAWGGRVQVCRDAQAALADYAPGSAAVALIDRNLPGLDGLELARRLRVGDPCLSVVIMTGWQAGEDLAAAAHGVVDLKARKPIALDRLRDLLNVGYQLNRSRRAAAARD